ncbi:MAG TPA: ATP-binding protein [Candidatus Thermoplasmatota archaeon]|nr:ATP-binding protein [Candidatus Thermoplasmatota archaeon]
MGGPERAGDAVLHRLSWRLVPAIVLIPVALGWLRLQAQARGWVTHRQGILLFAVASVVLATGVTLALLKPLRFAQREREAAEEAERASHAALAENERRTARAERATRRGSWELDVATDRAVWSEGLYQLFGVDARTFPNSNENFLALVHPEDRVRLGQAMAAVLQSPGRFLQEYRLIRPDGQVIHLRGEGDVEKDAEGKPHRVYGFVQDVSEIKEAEASRRTMEEETRQAQQRFEHVFHGSPVPIALSKEDGHFVEVNDAFVSLVGRSKEELAAPDFLPAELWDDPQERQRLVLAIRAKGLAGPREVRIRRKGGEVRTTLASFDFLDVGGNTVILSILQDVTEQKRMQGEREARIATEAELERLRRTDQFRAEFINSTAHELSTPLTPLVLHLRMVRDGAYGPLTAKQAEAAEAMHRNLERLRVVVQDMLAAAGLQARTLDIERRRLNVTRELRAAIASHLDVAQRTGITLEEGEDSGLTVHADQQRLQLVLGHLLGNAVKFTPAGGRVTVGARRDGDQVRVEVQDTGIGLTKKQMAGLWRAYSQGHDKMERTDSGSGLGLYVTKGIVELHGGEVGCESPGPGKGSTFWFTLPLASGHVDPLRRTGAGAEGPPPEERAGGRRVSLDGDA